MKIVALTSENVKRIAAVEIVPKDNLIVIGGRNGQGKTSVLDSIAYALGGKGLLCDRPVREGEKGAKVSVQLDGEQPLLVTRTFTPEGGGSLVVSSPDGKARYASPQKMLDALVGRLSFDPLAFARQPPRDQLETLKTLVGLDLSDLENQRRELYERRTAAGRDVQGRQSQLDAMPAFPDAPSGEVSVTALAEELQEANRTNQTNADKRRSVEAAQEALAAIGEKMKNAEKQIASWQEQVKVLSGQAADANGRVEEAGRIAGQAIDIDTAAIQAKIAAAEDANKKVRANASKAGLAATFAQAKSRYDQLTGEIEGLDDTKAKAIAQADMPIRGLSLAADGVMFKGLPFAQCSSAEQLRVSVAMGLAMNPRLKVLLIRDGSLLDEDSLRMVAEMAQVADAQVWLERVGEGAECSVVIEDGQVKETSNANA